MEGLGPFDQALIIIEDVAFDVPPALVSLRTAAGVDRPIGELPGHLFENDPQTFRGALEAVLSGWVDFRVLFSPPQYAIRADHDEYTTVFSVSPGKIAKLRLVFQQGGLTLPAFAAPPP